MINLLWTMFVDIFGSLRLIRPLEIMSIIVVTLLFCSPGGVATILGVGTKLGIYTHLKEKKKQS